MSHDHWVARGAIEDLTFMGPRASSAVPTLIRVMSEHPDSFIRFLAAESLGAIHSYPDIVIPSLTSALRDENDDVREGAAHALGLFGPLATSAVPELVAALREHRIYDPDAECLRMIDPEVATSFLKSREHIDNGLESADEPSRLAVGQVLVSPPRISATYCGCHPKAAFRTSLSPCLA
jgi:HEAT repeat protein